MIPAPGRRESPGLPDDMVGIWAFDEGVYEVSLLGGSCC